MRKANNISWGLFNYKPRYFWCNFRDIRTFIKRIFFTLKHGYAPQAHWETFCWFTDTMKEILTWHRNKSCGTPIVMDDYNFDGSTDEENLYKWHKIVERMLKLLDFMDEDNPLYENYDWKEKEAAMSNAKDEFFELFSKYFYNLWD